MLYALPSMPTPSHHCTPPCVLCQYRKRHWVVHQVRWWTVTEPSFQHNRLDSWAALLPLSSSECGGDSTYTFTYMYLWDYTQNTLHGTGMKWLFRFKTVCPVLKPSGALLTFIAWLCSFKAIRPAIQLWALNANACIIILQLMRRTYQHLNAHTNLGLLSQLMMNVLVSILTITVSMLRRNFSSWTCRRRQTSRGHTSEHTKVDLEWGTVTPSRMHTM